jgi:hypothetical protein
LEVVLPATVAEIGPSAFDLEVWHAIHFDGPPLFFATGYFNYFTDGRILFSFVSFDDSVEIPADIEVIGPSAFEKSWRITDIRFESGTKLREIGQAAFTECSELKSFHVPSSVETIADRCFEKCSRMTRITFEDSSKLRKIGERAFDGSRLRSITIPASTEEIDGSAFVGCPLMVIAVAPGSRNFKVEGNLLLRSYGTEIVRYFGPELEVVIPAKVEMFRKSCFEECTQVEQILFENDSTLRIICRSALSNCPSLMSISIPASVEVIEEAAFKSCIGRESCSIADTANLQRIENEAFSECCCLRSFSVPVSIEELGENCFHRCPSLHQLRFVSGETLGKLVGDSTLDDWLEKVGIYEISSVLRIEIDYGGMAFDFPGWSYHDDGLSRFSLVQDIA